ncbi:sortase B protein-sorting domain-containing protein [Clostridioides difficile]|uniref:sortase B protein-sorting domain-containing protein n=1 Tax=Clostridioides difficile TaxID=1496 RepID=UPI001F351B28|nr:sortase B protein-sorting domain-containing protein [Clostridioides difficile]
MKITVTNPEDKAIEGQPIKEEKVITPSKDNSTIVSIETNGISVNENGNITGTPIIEDWGKDEEEREITIPVTVTNGNEEKNVEVTVTVQRDTDGDGTPDITDTDDDGDGIPDTEEIEKGSNPKDPNSIPQIDLVVPPTVGDIENQTVVEGNAITPVTPEVTEGSTVTVEGLGDGLSFEDGTIQGTPSVDWNGAEETKDITITVKAEKDGATTRKTFVVTVQRDTDGDGTPDITDTDDDGDGIPDTEEIEKGSDPKDPNSIPKNNSDTGSTDTSNTGNNSGSSDTNNPDNTGNSSDPNNSNTGKDDVNSSKANDNDNTSSSQNPNNNAGKIDVKKSNNSVNKLGNLPKTGDESQTGLYGILASLAASILLLLGIKKRKEEGNEQD